MNWIAVTSSQIEAIGYAEDAEYPLGVKFKPTWRQVAEQQPQSIYEYANVTPDLFAKLLAAESVGSFFHTNIKSHPEQYPYRRAV